MSFFSLSSSKYDLFVGKKIIIKKEIARVGELIIFLFTNIFFMTRRKTINFTANKKCVNYTLGGHNLLPMFC